MMTKLLPIVSQLWLVPIDGGTPTALTAPNDGHGPDYGDQNAWQLVPDNAGPHRVTVSRADLAAVLA